MKKINSKQKALLHVTKAQLCLSDSAYRAILRALVGVESSNELTNEQLDLVMKHFTESLSRIYRTEPPGKAQAQMAPPSKMPMMLKVRAILLDLKLPWSYADRIARKMFGIDRVVWCSPEEIHKVLAALCYHQGRKRESKDKKGRPEAHETNNG